MRAPLEALASPARGGVCPAKLDERPPGASALRMNLADLARIELRDSSDRPQRLGALWAERPVVLVFLRHFG